MPLEMANVFIFGPVYLPNIGSRKFIDDSDRLKWISKLFYYLIFCLQGISYYLKEFSAVKIIYPLSFI